MFHLLLQGIIGVTSTLLMDLSPESDEKQGLLNTIMASARLLLTLINNMLDVRKLELVQVSHHLQC